MEDDIRAKSLPENYGSEAVRVLDTMSFTKGKGVGLLGSMSLRSQQYAGDYDAFEMVNMKERSDEVALHMLATRFKEIMKELKAIPHTYIGDIKAGSVEEWRVLPRTAIVRNGKVEGMDVQKSKVVLDRLRKDNVITEQEYKDSLKLLEGKMTPMKLLEAKKELKFHIIRWTPPEVQRGYKILRDKRRFTLEQAFSSPTLTKMDVISLVQNNRYTDFSMIYYFRNNGKLLNPDVYDIVESIKENIYYYTKSNNPFKALKRKFALAKFERDADTITKLTPILNSDLGRIYHVLGDIGTLIHLIEDYKPDPKVVKFEIDQFRNRLANVYQLKDYLRQEHTLIGEIESLLKSPTKQMLPKLESMEERLSNILRDGTNAVLKKSTKNTMMGGVVASYQWTRLGDIFALANLDQVTDEVVDPREYPYKVAVGEYVYHSPIPFVYLSGVKIPINEREITPDKRDLLRGLLPMTTQDRINAVQKSFQEKKARATEEARQAYLQSSAGQRQIFEERYQKYLEEHPEQRVFGDIVQGLTTLADLGVDLASKIGVPQQVIDVYKTFAPPTSKFYGGAIDVTKLYPLGQTRTETQIQEMDLLNPEWDPKKPVKGVKKTMRVAIPVQKQVSLNPEYKQTLKTLEDVLRDLSHFYQNRDPATSLGFRVVADDIYEQLPLYDNQPAQQIDKGHKDAQEYVAQSILGVNTRNPYPQPTPQDRRNREIVPMIPFTKDPRNPLQLAQKRNAKGKIIYDVPAQDDDQAILALQDRPNVIGPTMYGR